MLRISAFGFMASFFTFLACAAPVAEVVDLDDTGKCKIRFTHDETSQTLPLSTEEFLWKLVNRKTHNTGHGLHVLPYDEMGDLVHLTGPDGVEYCITHVLIGGLFSDAQQTYDVNSVSKKLKGPLPLRFAKLRKNFLWTLRRDDRLAARSPTWSQFGTTQYSDTEDLGRAIKTIQPRNSTSISSERLRQRICTLTFPLKPGRRSLGSLRGSPRQKNRKKSWGGGKKKIIDESIGTKARLPHPYSETELICDTDIYQGGNPLQLPLYGVVLYLRPQSELTPSSGMILPVFSIGSSDIGGDEATDNGEKLVRGDRFEFGSPSRTSELSSIDGSDFSVLSGEGGAAPGNETGFYHRVPSGSSGDGLANASDDGLAALARVQGALVPSQQNQSAPMTIKAKREALLGVGRGVSDESVASPVSIVNKRSSSKRNAQVFEVSPECYEDVARQVVEMHSRIIYRTKSKPNLGSSPKFERSGTVRESKRAEDIENMLRDLLGVSPERARELRRKFDTSSLQETAPTVIVKQSTEWPELIVLNPEELPGNISVAAGHLMAVGHSRIVYAAKILASMYPITHAQAMAIMVGQFESDSLYFYEHFVREAAWELGEHGVSEEYRIRATILNSLVQDFKLSTSNALKYLDIYMPDQESLTSPNGSVAFSEACFAQYPGKSALELLKSVEVDFSQEPDWLVIERPKSSAAKRLFSGKSDKPILPASEDDILFTNQEALVEPVARALIRIFNPHAHSSEVSSSSPSSSELTQIQSALERLGVNEAAAKNLIESMWNGTDVPEGPDCLNFLNPTQPEDVYVSLVEALVDLDIFKHHDVRSTFQIKLKTQRAPFIATVLHEAYGVPWMQGLGLAYSLSIRDTDSHMNPINLYETAVHEFCALAKKYGLVQADSSSVLSPNAEELVINTLAEVFSLSNEAALQLYTAYSLTAPSECSNIVPSDEGRWAPQTNHPFLIQVAGLLKCFNNSLHKLASDKPVVQCIGSFQAVLHCTMFEAVKLMGNFTSEVES